MWRFPPNRGSVPRPPLPPSCRPGGRDLRPSHPQLNRRGRRRSAALLLLSKRPKPSASTEMTRSRRVSLKMPASISDQKGSHWFPNYCALAPRSWAVRTEHAEEKQLRTRCSLLYIWWMFARWPLHQPLHPPAFILATPSHCKLQIPRQNAITENILKTFYCWNCLKFKSKTSMPVPSRVLALRFANPFSPY